MILEGCRAGSQVLCPFEMYWYMAVMVARAIRYYGDSFHGYRGVTYGGPLPPWIFNVVFGTII